MAVINARCSVCCAIKRGWGSFLNLLWVFLIFASGFFCSEVRQRSIKIKLVGYRNNQEVGDKIIDISNIENSAYFAVYKDYWEKDPGSGSSYLWQTEVVTFDRVEIREIKP